MIVWCTFSSRLDVLDGVIFFSFTFRILEGANIQEFSVSHDDRANGTTVFLCPLVVFKVWSDFPGVMNGVKFQPLHKSALTKGMSIPSVNPDIAAVVVRKLSWCTKYFDRVYRYFIFSE
jgi:hypothetical protein